MVKHVMYLGIKVKPRDLLIKKVYKRLTDVFMWFYPFYFTMVVDIIFVTLQSVNSNKEMDSFFLNRISLLSIFAIIGLPWLILKR